MSDKTDGAAWGPAWMYGPNGEAAIFERPEDVPAGWTDSPAHQPAEPPAERPKTTRRRG